LGRPLSVDRNFGLQGKRVSLIIGRGHNSGSDRGARALAIVRLDRKSFDNAVLPATVPLGSDQCLLRRVVDVRRKVCIFVQYNRTFCFSDIKVIFRALDSWYNQLAFGSDPWTVRTGSTAGGSLAVLALAALNFCVSASDT
jgi:hypothetical protein